MASLNVTALAPSPSASALLSPSNSSATPPLSSSNPSNSSAPPPQTPPPPPPSIPAAPPQSPSPESSPPPPSPSSSPPPPTPTSPPPSPTITPPPASPIVPPPTANAPPPTISPPPPPPLNDSPPPQAAPSPPPPVVVSSPPPPVPVSASPPSVSLSPPPPAEIPPQSPPSTSPPPPVIKKSPPPPITSSKSPPPPPSNNPPPSTVRSPPPPAAIPSSSPPIVPPPASQTNSSSNASSIPTIPTEKPTARSTPSTDTAANNTTGGGGGSLKAGPVAAIGIIVGFLALSLVIFAVWFVQKRKKKTGSSNNGYVMPSPSSQNSDSHFLQRQKSARSAYNSSLFPVNAGGSNFAYSPENGGGGIANSRSWFTYEELATATNGFSSNYLLGEGGFGCVYKGVLADGRLVAVKQLKAGGGQGEREFRAEVEIISRVHHRHLVSLVGYCIYEHQRILVYDYVPNDTLHHHLHGESRVMDWAARIKFAAGAARGIAYLHEDCNPRIIHRDIKSANILLDENFEAKVADFGLAKLMELSEQTHVSTRVMGTFGYMAPEYATSGKLTEKSDVYSFGVVLLELITGRKPVDTSQPFGDESLVEWARPLMSEALESGNFGDLVDPRLENFVESEMLRLIETAAACVRHSASKRPRMSQVVRALDMIDETGDITNGMKPGQSQVYDSREQSAQIRMFNRMAFGSQGFTTDSFDNSQTSWRS